MLKAQPQSPLEGMPLPTAALVIDTRGYAAGNYILKTLQREIETLCQEMQMKKVNQWRYLTHIIEYMPVGALNQSELQHYRNPGKPEQDRNVYRPQATGGTTTAVSTDTTPEDYVPTMTGKVGKPVPPQHPFVPGTVQRRRFNDIPDGNFKEKIREILARCDALRTKRVNATVDLGTQGDLGSTRVGDGMVRVIFITDAQSEDSLATAATYAAYLRNTSDEQQPLLSTLVICLNHQNRGEPPKMLIDALSWGKDHEWSHIDSCILVESYSEHGAQLNDETQEEHIEFLLYILIITDPLQLRIDVPAPDVEPYFGQDARQHMLPSEKCFSIGLSAFTYSTRWAGTLLNSGLTQCIAQKLIEPTQSQSKQEIIISTNKWLDEQYAIVESAIPSQVAGAMPELNALVRAETVVRPASNVFPPLGLNLDAGEQALKDLDDYANDLAVTYTTSMPQQSNLQDAIRCEPTIRNFIGRWTEDAGSPLMTVLNNAYRVLTDPRFFSGARGAVPRAKQQLPVIAGEIAERQREHQGSNVNPVNQREDLQKQYETERQRLNIQYRRFPFLGSRFQRVMQRATFFLWCFAALVMSLSGLAWLHHAALLYAPPIAHLLDYQLFALTAFVPVTILLVLFCIIAVLSTMRFLFSRRGSPLTVEITFLGSQLAFTLFGFIVAVSLPQLMGDSIALGLIAWLAWLPYLSLLTGIVFILVPLGEASYFLIWYRDVKREQERIVNVLNHQHLEAVEAVHKYLAKAFLLALMQRAALVDETGLKAGHYDTAIEQLQTVLGNVQEKAEERYEAAQQHLERITENQMLGPASSKLYLREELLDMAALNNRLDALKRDIHENPMFVEFAELLLRTPGIEAPAAILRNMEERPRSEKTQFLMDGYWYEAQCLLSTVTAQALTLSLEQPSPVSPSVDMFEKRYKGLDYRYQYDLVKNLLEQMKIRVANRNNKRKGQAQKDFELAMEAIIAWAEVLWKNDEKLPELVVQEGVLAYMERINYSSQTMRTKFIIRAAPTSRPMHIGQQTDTFLILFPLAKGSKLLRGLDIARVLVPFPDEELLALLSLTHYVSLPYKVEETSAPQLGSGQPDGMINAVDSELSEPLPNATVIIDPDHSSAPLH